MTLRLEGILASLYLADAQERFDQVEDAFDGTFKWLFEKDGIGFSEWLRQGKGIFWISGKPASGKSTLLKYAASDPRTRELLEHNNPGNPWVCGEFFFTNRGKETQKSIDGLLRRILYQLISQATNLVPFVEQVFRQHAEVQGEWILIYLEDALMNIVRQRKLGINICFFVDALDEHDEDYNENHRRLVSLLRRLIEQSDGKIVKILLCLTSRPENAFTEGFSDCPGFAIHEHTQVDIRTYVNSRMALYLRKRYDLGPEVLASIDVILKDVTRRAQGVFLWVKLVVSDLIEGLTDGESPEALHGNIVAIPGNGDLQELYAGILLRLPPKYLFQAFFMLHIAYAATEPLRIEVFFHALQITTLGNSAYNWVSTGMAMMERKLASHCRGFLEIQNSFITDEQGSEYHGPIVQFLHQSVKDYLRDSTSFENIRKKLALEPKFAIYKGLLSENGHAYLLRFRVCQHLQCYGNQPDVLRRLHKFDLRKFDVLYQAYMVEATLNKTITESLDVLSQFVDENQLASVYIRHGTWCTPHSWQPSFIALAVQAGLLMYVRYALEQRINIHWLGGRPLLHYSVLPMPQSLAQRATDPFLQSSKMVQLLVHLGADLEQAFENLTPLALIFNEFKDRGHASSSHLRILETLLRLGASVEIPLSCPRSNQLTSQTREHRQLATVTPLQCGVQTDDTSLVRLLLRFGADIDALAEADWKFLQRGYMFSDEPPEFDDDRDYPWENKNEKLEKWLRKRDRANRDGSNVQPMMKIIKQHQSQSRFKGAKPNATTPFTPSLVASTQRYHHLQPSKFHSNPSLSSTYIHSNPLLERQPIASNRYDMRFNTEKVLPQFGIAEIGDSSIAAPVARQEVKEGGPERFEATSRWPNHEHVLQHANSLRPQEHHNRSRSSGTSSSNFLHPPRDPSSVKRSVSVGSPGPKFQHESRTTPALSISVRPEQNELFF